VSDNSPEARCYAWEQPLICGHTFVPSPRHCGERGQSQTIKTRTVNERIVTGARLWTNAFLELGRMQGGTSRAGPP